MPDEGWIKLHRKMLDWEWVQNPNVMVLFITCLLLANHKTKRWQGTTIYSGQFITSLEHLAQKSRLTINQTRLALTKLQKTGEINKHSNNHYTLVSILKWETYQIENTNRTQTEHKQTTTNKNEKNEKNAYNNSMREYNENKHFEEPTLEDEENAPTAKEATPNSKNFIRLFKGVNPAWVQLWVRNPEHVAAKRLLVLHPFEWWMDFMPKYELLLSKDKYCPRATKPTQMEDKIGAIELHIKAGLQEKPKQKIWI